MDTSCHLGTPIEAAAHGRVGSTDQGSADRVARAWAGSHERTGGPDLNRAAAAATGRLHGPNGRPNRDLRPSRDDAAGASIGHHRRRGTVKLAASQASEDSMAIARERLTTEEIVRLNRQYTFFSWSAQARVNPIVIDRAEGIYFWDPEGKRYLDFNSQLMSVNIGHGDTRVADAIAEQAHDPGLRRAPVRDRGPRPAGRAARRADARRPQDFFFTLGGAEANENALRMARMVTGRQKVIARFRSYHGATAGAISVTGDPRRWASEPAIPGVIRVLDPWRWGRERAGAGRGAPGLPRGGHPVRGPADDRGLHPRDGHRHERPPHPARRLPPGRPRAVLEARDHDDRRRGHGRLRPHRALVRGGPLGRRARHDHDGQGPHELVPAARRGRDEPAGGRLLRRPGLLRRPDLLGPPDELRRGDRRDQRPPRRRPGRQRRSASTRSSAGCSSTSRPATRASARFATSACSGSSSSSATRSPGSRSRPSTRPPRKWPRWMLDFGPTVCLR